MRRAIMVVLFVFISSVVAFADSENLGETLVGLLKQAAIAKASSALENRLNRQERVRPVRSGQNLGRIVVSQADGTGWYDSELLVKWTENALREVGFEALSREGRELVKREMNESCAPEFNPETAQPFGQINGSQYFAVVAVRQGSGPDRQIRIEEGRVSVESDTRFEWACVTLQIFDATGAILASDNVEANDSATSLDVAVGWCNGVRYAGRQPTRRDRAVMAACIKATNSVGRQMADRRAGWQFDLQTGQRLDQPNQPTGWRLDPYTGRPLDQPSPANRNQIDPGEPAR